MRDDEIFEAEFRGLFFGEGCIDIAPQSKRRLLYPRLRIGMAKWERPVLEAIRDRFGGSIATSKRDESITWSLLGRERLREVHAILSSGVMPSPKRRELEIFAEAIELVSDRGAQGRAPGANERMEVLRRELSEAKGMNRSRRLSAELEAARV